MVHALIVACLLLVVGGLLDRCAAIARIPRRGIWLAALVAAVVLSITAPWRTSIDATAASPAGTYSSAAAEGHLGTTPRTIFDRLRDGLGTRIHTTSQVEGLLAGIWLSTTLGLLGIWITAHRALSRRRRTWKRAHLRGGALFVSNGTGPAVVGLLTPQIVVPAWAVELEDESLDLILRHEREHLRAGDVWLTHFAGAVLLLLPWNPFVWWMAARLRLAVEFDCDARVISSLARDDASGPAAYGELLLNIASRRSTSALLATPALVESSSTLGRRIAAMFPNRVRFGSAKVVAAAGAALVLALLALTLRLTPAVDTGTGTIPPEASESAVGVAPTDIQAPGAPEPPTTSADAPGTPGLTQPVAVRRPRPGYTPEAMRAKIQGTVTVEAVVGTDGRVRDARVIKSLDKEFGLDAAALDAARRWEFRPGTLDGRVVQVPVTLELQFTIH
jgi:TonB family protein